MDAKELYWVAGLLEGEGCFRVRKNSLRKAGGRYTEVCVEVNMTDEEVIRKLHAMVGVGKVYGPYRADTNPNRQPIWRWTLTRTAEVQEFMLALYPLLGSRRQRRIKELFELKAWNWPEGVQIPNV
jgi:hypothetical protein